MHELVGELSCLVVQVTVMSAMFTALSEGQLDVLVVLLGVPNHESFLLYDDLTHLRVLLLVDGMGDHFVVRDDYGNKDDHHNNEHKDSSDPEEGPHVLLLHPLSLGLLDST
jgi:hypothetical protein